ncbi:hypothetical protein EIB75_00300 [Epilithonimonas vandammei]|uniref:Leucine-rich repeat domain-containing protein n=1 Tax=Epilithonimonas vandammei TaxID=2487072 RepID=A0A3G8ZAQ7_9FLAO|nr:leucine-rich repeat domain-containing protein [Epilithonimonas vandammei]AZI53785.1 hypothetical protein EIB75_00300 [Epilithonimonas vandammei]
MKKSIFIIFLLLLINCKAQEISIKDEHLKNALLKQLDYNKNGKLDVSEIENVTELKLDEKGISDLNGIEQFFNLKDLNLRKNNISDFSVLNKLIKLENLYIGDNQKIDRLNLDKLVNLKGIYAFRLGLTEIKLNSNNIQFIYLQDNLFEEFNTNSFPKLHTLNLDGCKQLKKLNLSSNIELVQLYLNGTSIKKLNVSNNKDLKTMYVENSVELIKGSNQENLKPAPIIRVR